MYEIEVLAEFKKNLISFLDELIEQFPSEADLIILRIFINDQIPIKDIITSFNHKINKDECRLKKMVKERNEIFFLENNILDLSKTEKDKVNRFKILWRSGTLDDQDKKVVWSWIDKFILLGEKYIKIINKD